MPATVSIPNCNAIFMFAFVKFLLQIRALYFNSTNIINNDFVEWINLWQIFPLVSELNVKFIGFSVWYFNGVIQIFFFSWSLQLHKKNVLKKREKKSLSLADKYHAH